MGTVIDDEVVKERRQLGEAGLCVVLLCVDRVSRAVVRGPELLTRGVAGVSGSEASLCGEALRAIEEVPPGARQEVPALEEALRLAVRRWFRREGGRRPAVLPVVLEL
jgi:ribonuclease J